MKRKHMPIVTFDEGAKCESFAVELASLLNRAHHSGVVLTIRTKPQEPLAMGNYRMVGHARLARE